MRFRHSWSRFFVTNRNTRSVFYKRILLLKDSHKCPCIPELRLLSVGRVRWLLFAANVVLTFPDLIITHNQSLTDAEDPSGVFFLSLVAKSLKELFVQMKQEHGE